MRLPGHRPDSRGTSVMIDGAMWYLITSSQESSALPHSVSGSTHHAHCESCRTPNVQFGPESNFGRGRSISYSPTIRWYPRALVSSHGRRCHVLRRSREQAVGHSGNVARPTYPIRYTGTAESTHTRPPTPAFSQVDGQSAIAHTDSARPAKPVGNACRAPKPLR